MLILDCDVDYTQVDEDLPGYLNNNNRDFINHGPKFPEIYLILIRLWILKVGHKYSSVV